VDFKRTGAVKLFVPEAEASGLVLLPDSVTRLSIAAWVITTVGAEEIGKRWAEKLHPSLALRQGRQ
jgi:hypothetical protein